MLIVVGGNIPREPAAQLLAKGVHKIFLPAPAAPPSSST
jgi:methylmalonyl-CoA mutase cobalamin-binding subunit